MCNTADFLAILFHQNHHPHIGLQHITLHATCESKHIKIHVIAQGCNRHYFFNYLSITNNFDHLGWSEKVLELIIRNLTCFYLIIGIQPIIHSRKRTRQFIMIII